jgi:concanavalin A-like lectin/glucanase superfamily protein
MSRFAIVLGAMLASFAHTLPAAQPIPDLRWEPEPFRYESGTSPRYIDYAGGDDSNPGTKEEPWKHHPWDSEATGQAADTTGIHTYVFKRGVVYRGSLSARDSGEPNNPIRLTTDPSWGRGEATIVGSVRVSDLWKRNASPLGVPFPESSAGKIWHVDLKDDVIPQLLWVIENGEIVRVPIARTPNWTVSNPLDPRAEWWEWTDHKYTGRVAVESAEGFAVGDKIWPTQAVGPGGGAQVAFEPDEIRRGREASAIVITEVVGARLGVECSDYVSFQLRGKTITNGRVLTKANSDIVDRRHRLMDSLHLLEDDPGHYRGAMVWTEQHSYAGYGHPATIASYSPEERSVVFTALVPWLEGQRRSPTKYCRYFLENKPQFLDSPGEYYFDAQHRRLYLRLPGDRDPNEAHVEIARHPVLIGIQDQSHISISGMTFRFENIDDWLQMSAKSAAIRMLGDCGHIAVSHCRFEHVIKALSWYPLRDDDMGDYIALTDSDVRHTDHNAVAMRFGLGGGWGFELFPHTEPSGSLKHVKILRNNLYDIGHRPAPGEACHAIEVRGGELVEIAHNVVDRTFASGIQAINNRFGGSQEEIPLNRILVHHNKVTNTLLEANDWGGIASWGFGPSYVYNNISGNAVGHRHSCYRQGRPGTDADSFRRLTWTNLGPAFYFDHMRKAYCFNNIGWGVNNNLDDRNYSTVGYFECAGSMNHVFHNTFYNFAAGMLTTNPHGCYLGNLCLDIGDSFITSTASTDHLGVAAYANNLFQGDVEYFALGGGQSRYSQLADWRSHLSKIGALASETGSVTERESVRDAAGHDFRPTEKASGIDRGVKVFVPWGLYKVVGEWQFHENRADPTQIVDEHVLLNWEVSSPRKLSRLPHVDLVGENVSAEDYEAGLLEDWVHGALRFNGDDQYCHLVDVVANGSAAVKSSQHAGRERSTLNVGTGNFLIEAVFKTKDNHGGGVLVSKGDQRRGYHLLITNSGEVQLRLRSAQQQYVASSRMTVNDDRWHHLIAEVDRRNHRVRLYIDGETSAISEQGALPTPASLDNPQDFTVGRLSVKTTRQMRPIIDWEGLDSLAGASEVGRNGATTSLVADVPADGGEAALRVDVAGAKKWCGVAIPTKPKAADAAVGLDLADATAISFWIKSNIAGTFNLELHDTAGNASAHEFTCAGRDAWTRVTLQANAFNAPTWSRGPADFSRIAKTGVTAFGRPVYDGVYFMVDEFQAVSHALEDTDDDTAKAEYFHGSIDYLRLSKGTLEDAETTIEELYEWQFDGPFLRDFFGNKPTGARRDVGAVESP